MKRVLVLASVGALAAFAASAIAGEQCISCAEPAATYRCAVEQPSEKLKLGGSIEQEMCAKVLAKKGAHQKCQAVPTPDDGKCEGAERVVTVTDYQRAISANGESTYEEGAFEVARRNVHDTWLCVTSMFKDC